MLLQKVNADVSLKNALAAEVADYRSAAPVMATPAAAVGSAVVAAKVAGYVVGAGAVTGAAYVAYRTVVN